MPYKDPEKQREAKRRYEKKRAGQRHCVWMGVFYEDSAPYWRDDLDEICLPVLVSPLHDRDVWTASDEAKDEKHKAGTCKKAHRHWLAEYPQPVDYDQVKNDFADLHSGSIKWVKSKPAMTAYLCHLRSPEKAKYDPAGVLEFGGASYRDWCAQTEDVHAEMMAMREHIRAHACRTGHADLYEFWDWCDTHNDTWSRLLDTVCSAAIERYAKSIRGAMKTGTWDEVEGARRETAVYDEGTGEVLARFDDVQEAEDYAVYLATCGRKVRVMGAADRDDDEGDDEGDA